MHRDIKLLEEKAQTLRRQVLDMCVHAGTGHVTSSFSCAEILTALYYGGIMQYDPANPEWDERDRFVLSKGQASPILYAILADTGFFPNANLDRFAGRDGPFGVHLQRDVPGVEVTTGSLGHGLGIGIGMALSARMERKSYTTFVLLGDGECYEGSIWESAMFASHHKLNNLVAIIDRNWLCVTDFTENLVGLNPMDEKWRAFGWEAATIDGHSFEGIFTALEAHRSRRLNKPLVIIANTVKGKGIPFMENIPLWHAMVPKGREAELAKSHLMKKGAV